jgi:predicted dehydrogenase
MNNAVRVALVGIGGYGDSYLEALLNHPRAAGTKLVGLVDTMPQRSRRLPELRAMGLPIHSNLQSLFADTPVDLLMIATPIHLHCPQTCFALARDVNVLCEKPLAGTLSDGMTMVDAQRTSKAFAAIGYQWSFSAAVQSLKRDVMNGTLGRPIRMRALVFFPRATSYFARNDWAGRIRAATGEAVYDSPVNNATSHYLHNMFYVLGRTRETSAMPATVQAELYRANDIENYDTAAVRAVTDDGTEILFYTTHAVADRQGPGSRYEFENAVVDFDMTSGVFVARFRDGRVKNYGHPNLDRSEKMWQSVASVRSGEPVACGIRAALAHTACVAAAQESVAISTFPARLRETIRLEGEPLVCVQGLHRALLECYDRGVLPTEHGHLAWAAPGTRVALTPAPDHDTARRRGPTAATTAASPAVALPA